MTPIVHINLLSKKRRGIELQWLAVRGLAVFVLVMLAIGVQAEVALFNKRLTLNDDQTRLQALNAQLLEARRAAGMDELDAMVAQNKAMQARLDKYPGLLAALQRDKLDQNRPPQELFAALGSVSNSGVWLEDISLTTDNRVSLTGKALSKEAVVTYVKQLNAALLPLDMALQSLDVSAPGMATGPATSGLPPVVTFRAN